MSRPRRVTEVLLALALVWAAGGLVREALRIVDIYSPTPEERRFFARWRFGTPELADLERFCQTVDTTLPTPTVIAFRARTRDPRVARWAGYLLPRHEVIPLLHRRDLVPATAMASYGEPWQRPWPVLMKAPGGTLYRRP